MKKVLVCAALSCLVLAGVSQAALMESVTISSGSGNIAHGGILTDGSLNLTNRNHVYKQIPGILLDKAEYLKLSNNDRETNPLTLSFTLTEAADVYLIIDHRIGAGTSYSSHTSTPHPAAPDLSTKMAWVLRNGFVDQGLSISVDEGNNGSIDSFGRLYMKHFDAGTVTLSEQSDSTNRNMYGVAAVVPEPVSMLMLSLGGLMIARKRR